MRPILLELPLALFFCVHTADAGQVLKYSKEGTREGKTYRSIVTLSAAPEGIRVEAADIEESGAPKTYVFLYSVKDDNVYPIDPPTGPVISAATIEVVGTGARLGPPPQARLLHGDAASHDARRRRLDVQRLDLTPPRPDDRDRVPRRSRRGRRRRLHPGESPAHGRPFRTLPERGAPR